MLGGLINEYQIAAAAESPVRRQGGSPASSVASSPRCCPCSGT
jgi:hypothetical protein